MAKLRFIVQNLDQDRWLVMSESDPAIEYLVDLQSYCGNGGCDCMDFATRHGPKVKDLMKPIKEKWRCKHVKFICRLLEGPTFDRLLEQRGHPGP